MDITESKDMHSESSHGTIVKVDLNKEVAKDLYNWCDTNGISCIQPDKMHCTLLYSKIPVKKLMQLNGLNIKPSAKILNWKMLGRALVLELDCPVFHVVHSFCKKHGGIHEYDEYIPHLTVNYSWDKPLPKQIPKINLQFSNIKIEQIDPNFG
jgi:2'-5' RNA ligase